jgi:hypothetical protein
MDARRCTSPRPMATSRALRCWWSAAPTRRQRTLCAACAAPFSATLLRAASAREHLRSAAPCRSWAQARARGATGGALGSSVSSCCQSVARRARSRSITLFLLHMRLGCGLRLRVSPARSAAAMHARCRAALMRPLLSLRRCCCTQDGNTPLHMAAMDGHVACVALLVERGANREATDMVRCMRCALFRHTAACCIGTGASAQRCALQKRGASAREGRNWRRPYLRLLPICHAAQPPAPPRACFAARMCGAVAPVARARGGARAGRLAACCHRYRSITCRMSVCRLPLRPRRVSACVRQSIRACRAALTSLRSPPLRCAAVDARSMATRRCTAPRMAVSHVFRCWWSAAPTRRQRTACATLRPATAAARCIYAPPWPMRRASCVRRCCQPRRRS